MPCSPFATSLSRVPRAGTGLARVARFEAKRRIRLGSNAHTLR
jgi:hypothetical protein